MDMLMYTMPTLKELVWNEETLHYMFRQAVIPAFPVISALYVTIFSRSSRSTRPLLPTAIVS